MSDPVLKARGIRQVLGKRQVLDGVDLDLAEGELLAILGPNGAGKTTLLSILAGQRTPTSGTVTGPAASRRGWVPQSGGVWARLTVGENLRTFAKLTNCDASAALNAAKDVGLDDRMKTLAANLSGGMRQRLNLACGLVDNPPLLLLDEPTTGLDLVHRAELWNIVRSRQQRGTTVAFSTHSLDDATLADRVAVIAGGKLVYSGAPDGLADFAQESAPGADGSSLPLTHATHEQLAAGLVRLWGKN